MFLLGVEETLRDQKKSKSRLFLRYKTICSRNLAPFFSPSRMHALIHRLSTSSHTAVFSMALYSPMSMPAIRTPDLPR
jgi:hypothetical protein